MKSTALTGILFAALALTVGHLAHTKDNPAKLQVTSGMFQNGGTMPSAMTCDGNGIPPMLTWAGVPDGTKSFALEVRDLDTKNRFVHWIVTGIDKNVSAIGALPEGAVAGENSRGDNSWDPPCPPMGETHRYQFTVFALDKDISNRDFTVDKLDKAVEGHTLASGDIVAKYTRLSGTPSGDEQP